MRKLLGFVALAGLLIVWVITAIAVLGPNPLPDRIPTHFDLAGIPNGWGSPKSLWIIPAVCTCLYGLMTMTSRYPRAFNYPVRVTAANRDELQRLALDMVSWLKAEVIGIFALIQHSAIAAARGSEGTLSTFSVLIGLVVVFATIGWHIVAMRRTARLNLPG